MKYNGFFILGLLDVIFATVGVAIWSQVWGGNIVFVAITVGLGLITLFGMMGISQTSGKNSALDKEDVRIAITCSLLVVYFFIVGMGAFAYTSDIMKETSQMAQTMISNLTYLVGIVMVFYFGSLIIERRNVEKNE